MKTDVVFKSASEEWATPQDFFDVLNAEFWFTLDPCATHENHKCAQYFTKEDDGLAQDWGNETVFCNPPYGNKIRLWVEKCREHGKRGGTAVLLLPARTDTRWFHDLIYHQAEIRFVRGRLKFGGSQHNAPFPSMVVIFRNESEEKSKRA